MLLTVPSKAQSNIQEHVQALGQKYMGAKAQDVFSETSIHEQKGSPVPVQNFVNAQCMSHVRTLIFNRY